MLGILFLLLLYYSFQNDRGKLQYKQEVEKLGLNGIKSMNSVSEEVH